MKEYKIHKLWEIKSAARHQAKLNELELNQLARDGWQIVGFFGEDNLWVILERVMEDNNGLEK